MHSTLQPTGMPLARPRSRTGLVACVVLVAAVTFLSLYISAAIFLSVALTSLINLIGLAAAIALWTLPRKWLRITAMVVLGAIVALQLWLGFDLLAFCLLSIVGAMGLRRFKTWWLYVATGLVALISGWSGITLSLNRTLVPQLFTDAVPDLDLNTPPLIASCTIALVALVFLGIGIWRFALHIDVLAVALFVAAGAHLAGAVLSFYAIGLPMMLAELFPHVYEFDEESYSMASAGLSFLAMRSKDIVIGALFPIVLGIAGIVRLARQPSFSLRGAPRFEASVEVAALTALALLLPGGGLLLLAFIGDNNPLQLLLPVLIDLGGLVLWGIAVFAWWRHMDVAREEYSPGGELTRTNLVVTLLLAATPLILAALNLGFAAIP